MSLRATFARTFPPTASDEREDTYSKRDMVTSAVNNESPVTSVVNIEGFEEDKWIVVLEARRTVNSSKTDYLLKTE
jgi:hypothetical protein